MTDTAEELTPSEHRLQAALQKERTAHKAERKARLAAEAEAKALRNYQAKFYEARDKAELWQGRAIRYSNKLKTLQIKNSPRKAN
ncbi:hypothetical protein [Glutamicibacter halophytocola]|uniref:hypothetical protein n=1 Tax=Glutamicibacter halophytocola TaxID=1933880 RepID=UPI0015C542EF|nr:hypothetical protein [Glutamicibacter halophytocola]NQD42438.1 hypothetical protein [Glutamicibacter halophytocola]